MYFLYSSCYVSKNAALQESRHPGHGRENPVNSLTIRKSKFGLVGYTTITIDTLKNKSYRLQKVPSRSPLDDGIEMRLNVYSESRVEERGFLTAFMDANGFGNWCRRWCLLKGTFLTIKIRVAKYYNIASNIVLIAF